MEFKNYSVLVKPEHGGGSADSARLVMNILTSDPQSFRKMKANRSGSSAFGITLRNNFLVGEAITIHNVGVSVPLLNLDNEGIWRLGVVAQKRDDGTVLKYISGYVNWWKQYDDHFTATAIDELREELVVEIDGKQKVLKGRRPSSNGTPEQIIHTRNPYGGILSESFYRLHNVSDDLETGVFSNFWRGDISVEYESYAFKLDDVLFHIDGHHGSGQILFPKVISFGDNIQNIRFAESMHVNGKEEHTLQGHMLWIQLDDFGNLTGKVDKFMDGSRQACCIDPEVVKLSEAFAVVSGVSMMPNTLFSQVT